MGIFSYIKQKVFGQTESKQQFLDLGKMLLNQSHIEKFKKEGYFVTSFLKENELEPLRINLKTLLAKKENQDDKLFYTSGRDGEKTRKLAKNLSWPFVSPYLHRILHLENCQVEGCAWLLKPCSDQSELNPHQDSSLVDETKHSSFYGWIPLQDVDEQNGTINLIPGSHLWGINYRSLDVPWPLDNHASDLKKLSIPLNMKAGEILIFHSALVHGSGINKSDKIRAALNIFVRPKSSKLMHYMADEKTPKGKLEAYEIDVDFFLNHDFRKRPDTKIYPFAGLVNNNSTFNFDEIVKK